MKAAQQAREGITQVPLTRRAITLIRTSLATRISRFFDASHGCERCKAGVVGGIRNACERHVGEVEEMRALLAELTQLQVR